jgi:hypothetical protein
MARSWRRRSVLIAIVIVALSVGLVFSILPYLQPVPANAASISQTYTHAVGVENMNGVPGNFGLTLPNVPATEPFAVNVTVVGGKASFCVISYQTYYPWASAYNTTSQPFPQKDCTYATGETAHEILNFSLTPGTWDVVALNYSASVITVYYSPAP